MTRFSFSGLSNNVRNDQGRFETLTTEWVSPSEVKSLDHVRDECAFGISMDLNHKERFAANHAAQPLANETFQLFCDNSCSMNLVPINLLNIYVLGVWETGKPTRSCLFMVHWKIELCDLPWSPQAWTETMTSVLWEMFLSYLHRSLIQSCFSSLLLSQTRFTCGTALLHVFLCRHPTS